MGWYMRKRLRHAISLLSGIVTVIFFMMQPAPVYPVTGG